MRYRLIEVKMNPDRRVGLTLAPSDKTYKEPEVWRIEAKGTAEMWGPCLGKEFEVFLGEPLTPANGDR